MARPLAVIRGGGELGTGVGHALAHAGLRVLVVERPLPGALRLGVAFAAAVVDGRIDVEGVSAVHCSGPEQVREAWGRGEIPVWTGAEQALALEPNVLVDARMRRLTEPLSRIDEAPVVIGIGPGFEAGGDVDYVVESNRGPRLGRVLAAGKAEPHTGVPGNVAGYREERILRAPRAGDFQRLRRLGDFVEEGEVVGLVASAPVRARLRGMIRGLKLTGVAVGANHKVGDVDPRRERALLGTMTDKAHAVGQGVVEALHRARVLPLGRPAQPARTTGAPAPQQ